MLTTTRLLLKKPEDSDDLTQDPFNDNSDILDANPGVAALTTAQRDALAGAQLWAGRTIYNTTIGVMQVYTGSAWRGVEGAGLGAYSARLTANQSINNGATDTILATGEFFDYEGWYANVTGIYTPQVKGLYEFTPACFYTDSVLWAVNDGILVHVYKNGAAAAMLAYVGAPSAGTYRLGLQGATVQLEANGTTDAFDFRVQNSRAGGATVVEAATTAQGKWGARCIAIRP